MDFTMDSRALIEKYFLNLSEEQQEQFARLGEVYQEWNAKINVISRKDMEHIYLHHILHSLAIAKVCHFADGAKVLDVGCGGGFPSVPLAIMFPKVQFTACDSIGKKIRVVEGVCEGVLSGGQYDRLMKRMGKKTGAIGFAVYLDLLEGFREERTAYDIDTLVLYDHSVPTEKVIAAVNAAMEKGGSVRTATKKNTLRYREIVDLTGGGK